MARCLFILAMLACVACSGKGSTGDERRDAGAFDSDQPLKDGLAFDSKGRLDGAADADAARADAASGADAVVADFGALPGSWQPPVRLDAKDGAHLSLAYGRAGELWAFYNVSGAPSDVIGQLVCRRRPDAQASFGAEHAVYKDGRTAALHLTGNLVLAAVGQGDFVRIVESSDQGRSWQLRQSYLAGNNTAIFPAYLPSRFSPIPGGGLRLIYGFNHDSRIFGAHPQLWQATLSSAGVWDVAGSSVGRGSVTGLFQNGQTVVVLGSGGTFYSADSGASYTQRAKNAGYLERLDASGATQDEQGRLYLVRTYSYGAAPSKKLALAHSDDHGATWTTPQTLIEERNDHFFEPRVAVAGTTLIVAWLSRPHQPNTTQQIEWTVSQDRGQTWRPPQTLLSLSGAKTIAEGPSFLLTSDGARIALGYAVADSGSRKGVYLREFR
jgi:hypothetical protein